MHDGAGNRAVVASARRHRAETAAAIRAVDATCPGVRRKIPGRAGPGPAIASLLAAVAQTPPLRPGIHGVNSSAPCTAPASSRRCAFAASSSGSRSAMATRRPARNRASAASAAMR